MTYDEVKLATLQKMFNDVTSTEPTLVTKPYLDKMDYLFNSAIHKITSAGFGKKKFAEIILNVPVNRLGDSQNLYKINRITETKEFVSMTGRSFFFEVCGRGTVKIYVGDNLIRTIENTREDVFTKYKGVLTNDLNKEVKLRFVGGNVYLVKNIAVYDEVYENTEDIYEIAEMKFYDMEELTGDFYKFDSKSEIICDACNKNYGFLGEKTFLVPGIKSGQWKIPYIAYPELINSETDEQEEIDLAPEVVGIIPYYIASELYLEDDSGLCVGWRNKFEAELYEYASSRLKTPQNKMKFVSLAGGRIERV